MRDRFVTYAYAMLDRQLTCKSTKTRYRSLLRHAGPLRDLEPLRVTRMDVERALVQAIDGGAAPRSVRAFLSLTRGVLRAAGNVAADGLSVPVQAPEITVLSGPDAASLRDALLARGSKEGYGLALLLGTGLRKGELLGLRPEDWLPDRRQIRVARGESGGTKNRRCRYVDVPTWVANAIEVREGLPQGLCGRNLNRLLHRVCAELGLPRMRVHDLRHTRITQLLLGGAPALYVSEQAGHASPSFTMSVYGHLVAATQEQRRAWADL